MVPFENRMPFEIRTRLTIRNPDMSGFRIPTVHIFKCWAPNGGSFICCDLFTEHTNIIIYILHGDSIPGPLVS